ncbi:MAG: thioesterase [Deltaproteobacteria bacterium]|nr:thioesterase [Deltaproteobacteria bacterium]
MQIKTHNKIDQGLCGKPIELEDGFCRVELVPTAAMAADDTGLVHGGFIFGLADYAAMLAVNHPNVVLGAAEVKFMKPVAVGERVVAEADIERRKDGKATVQVSVLRDKQEVFSGTFTCFTLEQHVLKK